MKKTDLVEIKKGEYGTGLLIENDGYISMAESENNKKICELNNLMDVMPQVLVNVRVDNSKKNSYLSKTSIFFHSIH